MTNLFSLERYGSIYVILAETKEDAREKFKREFNIKRLEGDRVEELDWDTDVVFVTRRYEDWGYP